MRRQKKTRTCMLIFDRPYFKTKRQVWKWIRAHEYPCKRVMKRDDCFEARQREEYRFRKKTLVNRKLQRCVRIKEGKLR